MDILVGVLLACVLYPIFVFVLGLYLGPVQGDDQWDPPHGWGDL